MKHRIFLAFLLSLLVLPSALRAQGGTARGAILPAALTVERLSNPVGIASPNPRLSWVNTAADPNAKDLRQSAYRILVASSPENLDEDNGDMWDSGWVESDENLDIPYAGAPLATSRILWWKVAVRDGDGLSSDWSGPARWVCALVDEPWNAPWIAQPEEMRGSVDISGASWIGSGEGDELCLKKEFTVDLTADQLESGAFSGILTYAGNRHFLVGVNGIWTACSYGGILYPERLRAADVTKMLVPGKNMIVVKVWTNDGDEGDKTPAFLARFSLRRVIPTDPANPRRGKLGEEIASWATDSGWSVLDVTGIKVGGFRCRNTPSAEVTCPNDAAASEAKVLWAADDVPWGPLKSVAEQRSPAFERKFTLPEGKQLRQAILHITGVGFYEASLDGARIGDKQLDPSLTRYDRRVLYSTYDLSNALAGGGEHKLSVLVGHGWYDMRTVSTWNFDAAPWRDFPRMTARLDLTYTDATTETITTDGDWRCVASPILYDCIRQGEVYDANCRGEDLGPAAIVDGPAGVMTAEQTAPTMIVEEFRPKAVTQVGEKTWVVDLGKDISGWCRCTFHGLDKGQTVRMRYSERALEDGSIERSTIDYFEVELSPAYVAGEMGQFQSDIYIASGAGTETYQPRFSYNGFQYVEISGLDEAPSLDDITACVVSNAFPKTGSFACSNEMINALQAAAELSYRGNYVAGFPTDCPHREKNGWMGDAQLASELAMYNFDNTACYEKWLADIRDAQKPNGDLPGIVPTGGWGYQWGNGPAWDSALVIIPWMNYIYKGDKKILEDNYEAIRRYVDYMGSRADGRFLLVHGLCDWIPIKTETTAEVTSTGYWINDVKTAARIAEILGRPEDAARFNELEGKIREAFKAALVKDDGTVQVGSQTAQSCALYQGLLLGEDADKAFDRLVDRIASDGALDIGILGSKYLFRTLSERSRGDLALGLILQEGPKSFTDWIVRGGGTLWEDWGDGESRNHIMFGDFSAWFYQYLGGIRLLGGQALETARICPEEGSLAFRKFVIEPRCTPEELTAAGREPIRWADASVETVRGTVRSSWQWNEEFTELTLDVEVPVGCEACIRLPNADGVYQTVAEVGSGSYTYTVQRPAK